MHSLVLFIATYTTFHTTGLSLTIQIIYTTYYINILLSIITVMLPTEQLPFAYFVNIKSNKIFLFTSESK